MWRGRMRGTRWSEAFGRVWVCMTCGNPAIWGKLLGGFHSRLGDAGRCGAVRCGAAKPSSIKSHSKISNPMLRSIPSLPM